MLDPSDEARLVSRLKRRDERAFAVLVEKHQRQVFAIVFRMLGDRAEAEDVAQEVFVTVFKAIDRFRGDSKLSTWIYRIATNHCRNRIKYLGRRHHGRTKDIDDTQESTFLSALSDPAPRPDAAFEGKRMEVAVQEALAAIEPDHREVIVLRDLEQLPYQEIAEILAVAEGTVKSRLFRARAALQAEIQARTGP
ncbi:MAG: RNA polymerase sigma-70 factor (ECF subfamily) [Bradymonadia bacterium]|jgi:RNA polymerase sigma-70 factor (ECF subfamily)